MAENIEENSLKKHRKHWLLALLPIPLACGFCYFDFATITDRYYKSLDEQSPRPVVIQLSQPKMITSTLSDCTYDLSWTNENTLWLLNCQNDSAVTVNIQSGKISHERPATTSAEETYIKIFEPNGKNKMIAQCTAQSLAIRGGSTRTGKYEISLRRDEKIIATFTFSSPQWEGVDGAPDSFAAFSPSCEYFYLVLYGDFGPESFATKELWLLDIRNKSFELALTGRQEESYALFDVPVQDVVPSWSPDNQEFVFGDSRFGLEIYNVNTKNRKFVAGPGAMLAFPQWSPTHKWIAAKKYGEPGRTDSRADNFLVVISSDGKEMALSPGCSVIDEFTWSPNGKQLAYTCDDFSQDINSLWIWEIEK
jgi:hypothetical protein